MPAPAVYVIAIVGSVGIAIAFKEFIYPHLAPRIDRWKAAARKRIADAERSLSGAQPDVDHQDSYTDHSDLRPGKASSSLRPPAHPYLKNGLLIPRRSRSSETTPTNPADVELDWISSTGVASETVSQQQDLRLRKNNGSLIQSSHDVDLDKTTENHAFLDQSIQAIPYTPLTPVRTPTPTHPPLRPPFSTNLSSLPGVAKSNTDVINTSTYPLLSPLQPPSSSPSAISNASASNADSFPPSPPRLANIAVPGLAPFMPVSADGTRIPDSSATSSPRLALSSHSQLLSPTRSHHSPYQTPPHVHAIPSLSQSYPLDDVLDYEHGLELLSPPSPLSRTDSPFELTGLSPRPGMVDRFALLSLGSGDSGEQVFVTPVDSTNSTRSTTYVSFSSPALSASSSRVLSENGYENDFSPSEFSSTFSSPFVAPTRLGDIGSESFDVNRVRREGSTGWTSTTASISSFSAVTARSHVSDARRPIISFNDNISDGCADTQTLRTTRSPSTRTVTESVATTLTSTEIHPLESAARLSRVTTSDSDFDTSSELSDLDFLSMSAEEYDASASTPAAASGSVGLGSRSVVYTGTDGARGIGRLGIEDGNESDASSWSLAGGSE